MPARSRSKLRWSPRGIIAANSARWKRIKKITHENQIYVIKI
jgi:hypothetical protein